MSQVGGSQGAFVLAGQVAAAAAVIACTADGGLGVRSVAGGQQPGAVIEHAEDHRGGAADQFTSVASSW